MLVEDETSANLLNSVQLPRMFILELGDAREKIQTLTDANKVLTEKNDTLEKENEALKEQLRLLQGHRFGQSSEKSKPQEAIG